MWREIFYLCIFIKTTFACFSSGVLYLRLNCWLYPRWSISFRSFLSNFCISSHCIYLSQTTLRVAWRERNGASGPSLSLNDLSYNSRMLWLILIKTWLWYFMFKVVAILTSISMLTDFESIEIYWPEKLLTKKQRFLYFCRCQCDIDLKLTSEKPLTTEDNIFYFS